VVFDSFVIGTSLRILAASALATKIVAMKAVGAGAGVNHLTNGVNDIAFG
jgi:hypothetical protein